MSYTYLIGTLLFFPVWFYLYFHRKDLRTEILTMSFLIAIGGLFLEYFIWTVDWWRPETITGTKIGIEDFILGFTTGGICVAMYEEIFKMKLVNIRGQKKSKHLEHFLLVIGLSTFIGTFSFFVLEIHSFIASMLSMIIPTFVIFYFRKDLIGLSLWTGALITLVSIPIYIFMFVFDPNALSWWFSDKISMFLVLGIPIEDLIWFYGTGMFAAPLYELWQSKKLEKIAN